MNTIERIAKVFGRSPSGAPTFTTVDLAKDVLKYLDPVTAGDIHIKPRLGWGYVEMSNAAGTERDIQTRLLRGEECYVCAVGALAVAGALRGDGLAGYSVGREFTVSYTSILEKLGGRFTPEQLDALEDEFEGDNVLPRGDATGRLRAICENIIANGGKFVPTPPPEASNITDKADTADMADVVEAD